MKYKSAKEPLIDAIQFTRSNWAEVCAFTSNKARMFIEKRINGIAWCEINQLVVAEGNYIVKKTDSEFEVFSKEAFERLWKPAL